MVSETGIWSKKFLTDRKIELSMLLCLYANMTSLKKDKFLQFIMEMKDSNDYLKIDDLKDQYSYKIYARNAYVGIWMNSEKAFMISRYKVGPNPYLFHEYHWDTGEPFGTVKPLELIEKSPFEIQENYNNDDEEDILKYLDNLEECNPIIDGYNSLEERKRSAIYFEYRLGGRHRKNKA